jgi:hypothetical protein
MPAAVRWSLVLLGAGVLLGWGTASWARWARQQLLQWLWPLGGFVLAAVDGHTACRTHLRSLTSSKIRTVCQRGPAAVCMGCHKLSCAADMAAAQQGHGSMQLCYPSPCSCSHLPRIRPHTLPAQTVGKHQHAHAGTSASSNLSCNLPPKYNTCAGMPHRPFAAREAPCGL